MSESARSNNLQPSGKYHPEDLEAIGGVPVRMKHLMGVGLIHGDVITCTGKIVAENRVKAGNIAHKE